MESTLNSKRELIDNSDINNSIYEGDALEILKKIPDNSIHLIITSPPYNSGQNYDGYDDTLDWNCYREFLKQVIKELYRVLVSGGRLAINVPFAIKNKKTKQVKFLATMVAGICEKTGFKDFEFIVWHKGTSPNCFQGNSTAWGSWKSPSNPVFRPLGEAIMVFAKEQTRLVGKMENVDISADEFKNWTKNIWYFDNQDSKNEVWFIADGKSRKEHPCPYPDELVKRLIKLYSYRDDIVLDPFNGTGTTTKVAKELGRRFIGIDQSKKYCEIARRNVGLD